MPTCDLQSEIVFNGELYNHLDFRLENFYNEKASNTNIIYIMGAGRSGTTALATFLGNNNEIENIGEMHQFFEFLDGNKVIFLWKVIK